MRGTIVMALCAAVPLAPGAALAQAAGGRIWDFRGDAVNAPPAGFAFGRTGRGREGRWVVLEDRGAPSGGRVLAQTDPDGTDYRFPLAVADEPRPTDLRLEVRCKAVGGKVDEACGLVFRFVDADDYYVARANALEDNVNLYRVVKGRRSEIRGWRGKVTANEWHSLAVEARGDRLRVFWEGKPIIDARDGTFRGAGKVGLWTKADSVTWFDSLTVTPLG